jgi:hypothetical protein
VSMSGPAGRQPGRQVATESACGGGPLLSQMVSLSVQWEQNAVYRSVIHWHIQRVLC